MSLKAKIERLEKQLPKPGTLLERELDKLLATFSEEELERCLTMCRKMREWQNEGEHGQPELTPEEAYLLNQIIPVCECYYSAS